MPCVLFMVVYVLSRCFHALTIYLKIKRVLVLFSPSCHCEVITSLIPLALHRYLYPWVLFIAFDMIGYPWMLFVASLPFYFRCNWEGKRGRKKMN